MAQKLNIRQHTHTNRKCRLSPNAYLNKMDKIDKMPMCASNASKHPGLVDRGGNKRKRRTKAEIQTDAEKKAAKNDNIEKKKLATISRIAALEDQMKKQDADIDDHLKEGRRPQRSCKVVTVKYGDGGNSATGSDFQLSTNELTEPEETHNEETETAKPRKGKLAVQEEIKLMNAKVRTEHEQRKGKVRSLIC